MNLRVSDISKSFDGTVALKDVNLSFPAGSITTIVGPNGSGKTTLFNIISGLITPDYGSVFLEEEKISGRPAYLIASKGIGRLFQRTRTFAGLSVFDNLQVASDGGAGEYPMKALFNIRKVVDRRCQISQQAKKTASTLGLTHLLNDDPSNLSYGQLKMLAIGQLLMRRTPVLLLDELTAGLDEQVLPDVLNLLVEMKAQKRTIVLIEHRWELTKSISDAMAILSRGEVVAEGPPSDILNVLVGYERMW